MPFIDIGGDHVEYEVKKGRSRKYIYLRMRGDVVEIVLPDERWLYFVDPRDVERVYRKSADKAQLLTANGFYFDGQWVSGRDGESVLRRESGRYLDSAVKRLSGLMDVRPRGIRIVDTRYWGSCSAKGVLSFNFRIACLPGEMREYLVIHELAHLIHFSHSKLFWQTVEELCPRYKEIRKGLKKFRF